MIPELQKDYKERVVPHLQKLLGFKSVMQVPKVTKITINMGLGEAVADKKIVAHAVSDLEKIAGQKAVVTLARKSIAGFKIRDGWPIGCKVTLRKKNMYHFLKKLIEVTIPRIRDFRGYSIKSFDGRGNYTLGIKEQTIFPEIDFDKVDTVRGMDICITTTAQNNEEGIELLRAFGFPFKEKKSEDK